MKRYRYNLLKQSIILIITLIFFALSVSAIECSDCSDCNSKIIAAAPGDTIYLNTSISNHAATCITINKSDITFDCQDNTMDGADSSSSYGFKINNPDQHLTNITIKNCVINDFYRGIYFDGSYSEDINNTKIENIALSSMNSNYGLWLDYAHNNNISGITMEDCRGGIYLYNSDSNNFEDINMSQGWDEGVKLEYSNYNIFHNINATDRKYSYYLKSSHFNNFTSIISQNAYYSGIILLGAYNNHFSDVSTKESGDYDLKIGESFLSDPGDCTNTFNNVTGSGGREIIVLNNEPANLQNKVLAELILCNADNSNIINITITGSSSHDNNGLFAYFVDDSNFTEITSNNNQEGIYFYNDDNILYTADNNYFYDIVTLNNDNNGLYFKYSDHNNITHVDSQYSGYAGFFSQYSNNNSLMNANLSHNQYYGLYVGSSESNIIRNINASNNKYGISLYQTANSDIQNVIASDNTQWGLELRQTQDYLQNITVKENKYWDINYQRPISSSVNECCNNTLINITGSGDREIIYSKEPINIQNLVIAELILCNADNSNITNVTIQGSSVHDNNGLYMYFTDNANLTGIISNENYYGISAYGYSGTTSNGNTFNNIIANENSKNGLYLYYFNNNNLSHITTENNGVYNFESLYSDFNIIESLTSAFKGIRLYLSDHNSLKHITANVSEIRVQSSSNNFLRNITFIGSTQYGLYLSSATQNNIEEITIPRKNNGIYLSSSDSNNFTNITIADNADPGIKLSSSDSNIFQNITSSSGDDDGIYCYGSQHNEFLNMTIRNNNDFGIRMIGNSDYNSIIECYIEDNDKAGINLSEYWSAYPEFNIFYNNIFNNSVNFLIDASITNPNYWNTTNHSAANITNIINGTIIGGNAWATPARTGYSQTCMDSEEDGICDEQYNITADGWNIDYFPLAYPPPPICINYANETVNVSYKECNDSYSLRECIGSYTWNVTTCYDDCGYYNPVHQCLNASCVLCPTSCTNDSDCDDGAECHPLNNRCLPIVEGERPPRLIKDIEDIVMTSSETLTNIFDLDHHFYDPEGAVLTYFHYGNNHTTITIDESNRVTITAQSDWYGQDYVIFVAEDDKEMRKESNNITITILPKEGFLYDIGSMDYYPWTDIYSKSAACYTIDKYGNRMKCSKRIRIW